MELENILIPGLAELGLEADAAAIEKLRAYYDYLVEMNKVMNLTAITSEVDAARLHFLDCAAVLRLADFSGKRVIDVGTGAGFPGMVLKILCPSIKLTLLDSLDKRISFLNSLCEKLAIVDVETIHCRAEEAPRELRGSFDIVTSRAVARLNVLSELCLPLVRSGGLFIAMKGPGAAEELSEAQSAAKLLCADKGRAVPYSIPGTDTAHSAVIFRKLCDSPAKYPRRWAQIKKQPL